MYMITLNVHTYLQILHIRVVSSGTSPPADWRTGPEEIWKGSCWYWCSKRTEMGYSSMYYLWPLLNIFNVYGLSTWNGPSLGWVFWFLIGDIFRSSFTKPEAVIVIIIVYWRHINWRNINCRCYYCYYYCNYYYYYNYYYYSSFIQRPFKIAYSRALQICLYSGLGALNQSISQNLYSAPSRYLLRGTPDLGQVEKNSLEKVVELRTDTIWEVP